VEGGAIEARRILGRRSDRRIRQRRVERRAQLGGPPAPHARRAPRRVSGSFSAGHADECHAAMGACVAP